jgi:5-methyltetrahydrofolate--homocysteine methyltransferase
MDIIEKINRHGLLMDGAMGSVLIRQGLAGNEAAESWNIKRPDIIKQVHADYFDAGADVVTANTYGASQPKLKKMGADREFERINREGVRLAKSVCGPGQYVAADMGAMGEMLAPAGPVSFEKMKKAWICSWWKPCLISMPGCVRSRPFSRCRTNPCSVP